MFLKKPLENPDNHARVWFATASEVIERRSGNCRGKAGCIGVAGTERDATPTTGSNQTTDLSNDGLRSMKGPAPTARAAIRGMEAVHMIRKGRVPAITRKNRHGQVWVLGAAGGRAVKLQGVVERRLISV